MVNAMDEMRETIVRRINGELVPQIIPMQLCFSLGMTANDYHRSAGVAEQRRQAKAEIEAARNATEKLYGINASRKQASDQFNKASTALIARFEADSADLLEAYKAKLRETDGELARLTAIAARAFSAREVLERTASAELVGRQTELDREISEVQLNIQATRHQATDPSLSDFVRNEAYEEIERHELRLVELQAEQELVNSQKLNWENFALVLPKAQ